MKQFLAEVRQMMDQLVQGEEEVLKWVEKSRSIDSLERLPGDASTRRYYRVKTKGVSHIIMRTDPFEKEGLELPFLVVQRHLDEAQVSVPKVLDVDPARGFILLEDLGDRTLLRKLQEVDAAEVERHLYEGVIDALVQMQVFASPEKKPAQIEAYKLRFDVEKLFWEVEFTNEHFYGGYLKRKISATDRKIIVKGFTDICEELAAIPTVFTHRDFHSRNIMLTDDERLVMIDFQDARMGPPQYDLASLLKDSYYQLEEAQITRLLDYYVARWEATSGSRVDRDAFLRQFDLMSVQRNFKAIGSFASFMNRRGDPGYLKYIGNTFENIRRVLLKYPEFSKLREVLFHYYYF